MVSPKEVGMHPEEEDHNREVAVDREEDKEDMHHRT